MKPFILGDHFSVVYIIAPDENGPVKIGRTVNIQERLAALQTGAWLPLRVFHFRLGIRMGIGSQYASMRRAMSSGAASLERLVHRKLDELGFRLIGEWFDLSVPEAIAVLDKCGSSGGVRSITLGQIIQAADMPGADAGVRNARNRALLGMMPAAHFVKNHVSGHREGLTGGITDISYLLSPE